MIDINSRWNKALDEHILEQEDMCHYIEHDDLWEDVHEVCRYLAYCDNLWSQSDRVHEMITSLAVKLRKSAQDIHNDELHRLDMEDVYD